MGERSITAVRDSLQTASLAIDQSDGRVTGVQTTKIIPRGYLVSCAGIWGRRLERCRHVESIQAVATSFLYSAAYANWPL